MLTQKITMRKISLSSLLLVFLALSTKAQNTDVENIYKSPASDFFMIHIQNDFWLGQQDSMGRKTWSPSVGVYLNKDFRINQSHFSVSVGLGMASTNSYFDDYSSLNFKDTTNTLIFADSVRTHSKFKYSQIFLEAPIELRYFSDLNNRNKGFKWALGMKVGNLLSAYTKEVYSENQLEYKDKLYTRRFAERWRLTPYMRAGWGNFSLIGSFQLTPIFSLDATEAINPWSIGISISGL